MGTSLKKVAKKAKDYKYVLLVMRHAKTEPFGDGGDAGRELTDKGRKQAKAVAKGLAAPGWIAERGLDCYEYQCGKGVHVGEDTARIPAVSLRNP